MTSLELFHFLLFVLEPVLSFNPEIKMPFTKILGSSKKINPIGNTLKCADGRNNTQTSAEECFSNNQQGEQRFGFLKRGTNCYVCEVLDAS